MQELTLMRRRAVGCAITILVCMVGLAGCAGPGGGSGPRAASKRPTYPEKTRGELLEVIHATFAQIANIKARARVQVAKKDQLIPASVLDAERMKRGEQYKKTFFSVDVNGYFIIDQNADGSNHNVKFGGTVVGQPATFLLLGAGDRYWVRMPNAGRDPDDRNAPRNFVMKGALTRSGMRPKDNISLRPQDIPDLLFCSEAGDVMAGKPGLICYLETWPESYILTFIHKDRPESIYSRIWVRRKSLQVSVHQIFDPNGEIVAEARFGKYEPTQNPSGDRLVELPREVVFLWPRDYLVLACKMDMVKVNSRIAPGTWKFRSRPGDKEVALELPEATKVRDAHVASRRDILNRIMADYGAVRSLDLQVQMTLTRQDLVIPATSKDARLMKEGQRHEKRLLSVVGDGRMLLEREKSGVATRIRLSGAIRSPKSLLTLVDSGHDSWVRLPALEDKPDRSGGVGSYVFQSKEKPDDKRAGNQPSLRPRDIADLMLPDATASLLRDPRFFCYREVWRKTYLLTFLRSDWPQYIHSRIWVDRKSGDVTLHQRYDRSGRVVAEARFADYKELTDTMGMKARLPRKVLILWPRDHLVLEGVITVDSVNKTIAPKAWQFEWLPGDKPLKPKLGNEARNPMLPTR
jgi:hypothetical protein